MTGSCLTSRTWPRRLIVTMVGHARRPCPGRAARLLPWARRAASFADWVAVRAGDVVMELEDIAALRRGQARVRQEGRHG